jgi:hypothetical protein
MRKTLGYVFLALSVVAWVAIAALPFLQISVGTATLYTAVLLIGGEIAFVIGVALLGAEAWGRIKSMLKRK